MDLLFKFFFDSSNGWNYQGTAVFVAIVITTCYCAGTSWNRWPTRRQMKRAFKQVRNDILLAARVTLSIISLVAAVAIGAAAWFAEMPWIGFMFWFGSCGFLFFLARVEGFYGPDVVDLFLLLRRKWQEHHPHPPPFVSGLN
jgi:hypothetical protein